MNILLKVVVGAAVAAVGSAVAVVVGSSTGTLSACKERGLTPTQANDLFKTADALGYHPTQQTWEKVSARVNG